MKIVPIVAAFLFCLTSAFAQEPKVRASIPDQQPIFIGQHIVFVVELFAPGFFDSAPDFDLPDPPGLLLMPPTGSPTLSSETIDGVTFTIQRHELAIFARRAGEQTVPPLTVRFRYKHQMLDHAAIDAAVTTPPLQFAVKAPPGAENLGSLISARNLTAVEAWNPEPGKAKAGDAFTRTITFSAPDIPGMAFPIFPADKIDGLGIYPKAPEVLDEVNRGALTGKRRDTIVYVCQRAGQFVIPAAQLKWFDLDAQQLRTIDFPARRILVAVNPAMKAAEVAASKSDWREIVSWSLGSALGIFLLAFLLWKTRAFWRRIFDAFRPIHLAPLNPGDGSDAI